MTNDAAQITHGAKVETDWHAPNEDVDGKLDELASVTQWKMTDTITTNYFVLNNREFVRVNPS